MSQIFEFHFNPSRLRRGFGGQAKNMPDFIFDSFCFEPNNIYEKKAGSLYMVGFLKNVLPPNTRFLDALAQKIKEKYYKAISSSPGKSLRDALKTANEHLEKIAKAGDVSWLGNLSFTVISLKDFELNFTKVGDLKIFLIRKGQLIDIEQKLKFDEIEPYPLKIFGNIVSARLAENDIFLVLSKEVYDVFLKENLLNEIVRKSLSDLPPVRIKKFKDVLNGKKEQLTKISGICLLMLLSGEIASKEKEMLAEKGILKIFSFNHFLKTIKKIKIPKLSLKLKNPFQVPQIIKLAKQKTSLPKIPQIRLPKIKKAFPLVSFNKKIALFLVLIAFLFLGFYIFEKREEREIEIYQNQINQIQEKTNRAESYLILAERNPQAKKNANILFKESWNEIIPLLNISSSLPSTIADRVLNLKNVISENLGQLNKLVEITEPELIFEFNAREFIPQKIIFFNNEIYFFSPYSKDIVAGNLQTKDKKFYPVPLDKGDGVNMAALFSNYELPREAKGEKRTETSLTSLIFFSKPNQIVSFQDGKFSEPISLKDPYADFYFTDLAIYRSNLYFLDNKNGVIVRYPHLSGLNWQSPELWFSPEIKTAGEEDKSSSSPSSRERDSVTDFKSMAVDGSIWILTKKNTIERYHSGRLQETVNLEIFPEPKAFSKIFTTLRLPYLYILEPEQKRIIILDKSGSTSSPQAGQIIKQYQSEKFDNLLDFSVSEDGKYIYLLNGLKVYQINF